MNWIQTKEKTCRNYIFSDAQGQITVASGGTWPKFKLIQAFMYDLVPRWGTQIFSYVCRLVSFFGVQNFEFQYFWGFSEKRIFFGYEDFVKKFWGSLKN